MSHIVERPIAASSRRRALLEALLSDGAGEIGPERTIPRRNNTGPAMLSFSQQRLWFFDQLMPGNPTYNLTLARRIEGALDVARLEQSLLAVVRRHDILRTTIRVIDGQPRQVVAGEASVPFTFIDLRSLPPIQRDEAARCHTAEEALRPFNLTEDVPLRVLILQLQENVYHLFVVAHHIAFDVWSFGILFRELTSIYQASLGNEPVDLPELPIQYADYAEWQRDQMQGTEMERQLTYWKQRLADAPPMLDLRTDKPRPPQQSFAGASYRFAIPAALLSRLRDLSQRENVTLFMIFLAAYQVLLARYTGQEDIVVGSPIAERRLRETEGLIGFFINTLALRSHIQGASRFTDLLHHLRETTLEDFQHSDVPFDGVVEELHVERLKDRPPLFQVLFVFQNALRGGISLADLSLSPLEVDDATTAFDLVLSLWSDGDSLQAELKYASDLFHHTTMARFASNYEALLTAIVSDPTQRVADLPVLTPQERTQLLHSWNTTKIEYPRHLCLHQLFEAQAARTPTAPAVVCGTHTLTYQTLNAQANRLAHHLRSCGVGPEVLVGLCVDRSVEMIVALLAILKAGGAYLPLDPAYPSQRLAHMLDAARPALILTQAHLCTRLAGKSARIVPIEEVADHVYSDQNPDSGVTPQNLIYVIYTSGSTGTPRGSMVVHSAVVNHARAMIDVLGLRPDDRFLQFASLSFDAAGVQIFSTLSSGACLIIHPAPAQLSNSELMQLCADHGVTILDVPTAFWHQMVVYLATMSARPHPRLRLYLTGGEAPSLDILRTWSTIADPQAVFLSSYGPTEATITTTIFVTPNNAQTIAGLQSVPLGQAIANAEVYVLDSAMHPVPVGVVGELYIGGAGLARGYLGYPDLTASKFLPHPFSAQPGDRLYKSGDLVRFQPDGTLEFVGRTDRQVKIRGFRIELADVQAALISHPCVQECTVLVREDEPGDRRLVAYVVPASRRCFSAAELRAALREQLPEYMVPSAIVALERLPLTVNGKLDFRMLPPVNDASEDGIAYVAPRNAVEAVLSTLWCSVLRREQVGIHDNFFEAGGYSLLAMQLLSRCNRTFRMELPLRVLFDTPTIAGVAEALIQYEPAPGQVATIARLRQRIDAMSPEQRRELLEEGKHQQ